MPAEVPPQETIAQAYRIARRDLRACYNPIGIVAGRLHFNAYWARDGFWAALGALALGDAEQVTAQLETFSNFQSPGGTIPVRIEFISHDYPQYPTMLRRPKVVGRAGGLFRDPVDAPALYVVLAHQYLERTGDAGLCGGLLARMRRALEWLRRQDRDGDGLIESHFLADWMDSIMKPPKVFNINVIYYAGWRAYEAIARTLGQPAEAEAALAQADPLAARLREAFWTGDYFRDWAGPRDTAGFSSDGNVAAIFYGVATEAEGRRILETIRSRGLDGATPLRTCDPRYPFWRVFPFYYLAGIPDYHQTLIWPWLGTLNAVNKARLGDRAGALRDLAQIGAWYVREGAVNEVYTPEGSPVSRRFYSSEVPFAWNAGLYVYAVHELGLAPPSAGASRTP